MPRPSLTKRLLFLATPTVLLLAVLEGGVRVADLERWLRWRLAKPALFSPMLGDHIDRKPSSQYSAPTERDGRKLTRIEGDERITVQDPIVLWRLKPDAVWEKQGWTIITNSLGFRDREWPAAKPAGEVRILCMGDSVTFGWKLDEKDLWTTRLGPALDGMSTGPAYRVMNAGVYAHTSVQGLALLEEGKLLGLHPDVAIVTYGANDATGVGRALTDVLERSHRRLPGLLDHLAVYRCLRLVLIPARDRLLMAHSVAVSKEIYRDAMTRIVQLLKARGVATLVVGEALVDLPGSQRIAELPSYVRLASEIAAREGVPFLDLSPSFARHVKVGGAAGFAGGGEATSDYFFDACHPTAKGAGIVVDALHRELAATVLSGKVRPPAGQAP
ncbi:MAG: GDSL-type esterase/lipase family protein [Acidobacteriota bacterium]